MYAMYSFVIMYRIFIFHLLSFRNILFNIFSIYNLIISIANLTSIPNDSKINLKINSIYLIYLHTSWTAHVYKLNYFPRELSI